MGRRRAPDGRRPADVRSDAVLSDAGAALLHAGGRPDDGRPSRAGTPGFRIRGHEALDGRRIVDHGRRFGGVRRRVGQRGRQRLGPRLGAHPLAEEPRLPCRALRREQRHVVRDRHSDPAVDPDDPLRAREQHERGGSVRGRAATRLAYGSEFGRHLLVDLEAPRLQGIRRASQSPRAPQARPQVEPGHRPAHPDHGRPALWIRDPDRNGGSVGRVLAPAELLSLPGPHLGAVPGVYVSRPASPPA